MSVRDRLAAISTLREQEPMSRHTTFGVGGPAEYFVVARKRDELAALVQTARAADAPYFLLGSGSNLLVGDDGIRGVVIENRADGVSDPRSRGSGITLCAEAGASFARLARAMARQGISGLEWAAGIPGTLGGAVVYNAGAYGGCLADVLTAVQVLELDGREAALPAADLGLEYRSSAFTRGVLRDRIILRLTLQLQPGDPTTTLARLNALEAKRKASQPRGRNAGSIFKNPTEHPAWWLIDHVGLRGHRIGDALISEKHTNYFMNVGTARAQDVWALMEISRTRVRETFGIDLEAEVRLVGEGFA